MAHMRVKIAGVELNNPVIAVSYTHLKLFPESPKAILRSSQKLGKNQQNNSDFN